jgi:hypothetical protein
MEFGQAYQAFLAGQGDVLALNPPLSYKTVEHGWIDAGSMTALSIPLNDTLVCNPKTFKDPKKQYALEKYLEFLYDANEIMRANLPLAEDRLLAWYKQNGSNVAPEDVAKEIRTRLLLTRADARSRVTVGAAAKGMAEFMVSVGTLQADKLPRFTTNVNTDLWKKVVLK